MSKTKDLLEEKPSIAISWETAEYLRVLIGQVLWGNQERARKACAELGEAMQGISMDTSRDCFSKSK